MSWFDPNDLETMDYFGAFASAVQKPSAQLADKLNVVAATARERASKSLVTAADAAKMATAWDQVSIQLRTDLATVELRMTNPQTIARSQAIRAALANVDWYSDFAKVVGQEATAL